MFGGVVRLVPAFDACKLRQMTAIAVANFVFGVVKNGFGIAALPFGLRILRRVAVLLHVCRRATICAALIIGLV